MVTNGGAFRAISFASAVFVFVTMPCLTAGKTSVWDDALRYESAAEIVSSRIVGCFVGTLLCAIGVFGGAVFLSLCSWLFRSIRLPKKNFSNFYLPLSLYVITAAIFGFAGYLFNIGNPNLHLYVFMLFGLGTLAFITSNFVLDLCLKAIRLTLPGMFKKPLAASLPVLLIASWFFIDIMMMHSELKQIVESRGLSYDPYHKP